MDLYHLRQGLHVMASSWDYHRGAESRVSVCGKSVRFTPRVTACSGGGGAARAGSQAVEGMSGQAARLLPLLSHRTTTLEEVASPFRLSATQLEASLLFKGKVLFFLWIYCTRTRDKVEISCPGLQISWLVAFCLAENYKSSASSWRFGCSLQTLCSFLDLKLLVSFLCQEHLYIFCHMGVLYLHILTNFLFCPLIPYNQIWLNKVSGCTSLRIQSRKPDWRFLCQQQSLNRYCYGLFLL
jgi:hypothetical protein